MKCRRWQTIAACAGMVFSVSAATGQAIHNAYIWIEGPNHVLAPNTTYTLEVWGRIESSAYVEGVSMMAGFGIDVLNLAGASSIASVSNVSIEIRAEQFGTLGLVIGHDVIGTSGGQLPLLFGILPPYPPDVRNPIPLFQFDFTTGDGRLEHISFSAANPNVNGGMMFYPNRYDGASIIVPNDADTALHLSGWTSVIPAPGSAILGLAAVGYGVGRRRGRDGS